MKVIITAWCILLLSIQLKAEESKKTYEKTFSKDGIEELVVSNSYGKVEVMQNEGNEIQIAVGMKVIAKSGVKADETLDLIQILETQMDHYLNIETKVGKDLTFKQFISGMEISIDYRISIPKGIKLRLIATNGNVYLGNFEGELNVDIRSGDFKAATLKGGEFNIKQDKGDFKVENVASMNGDFKNSTIQIESGDHVRLTTSSCEGQLESVDKLNVRSSGGSMKIGDIEELVGSSSYTKYEVQDLANIMDMDMKWGEMNVRNIQLLFSEVRLNGSFTKMGLTFAPDAGYNLEIKRNKSAKIDLPRQMKLEERPTSERNTTIGTKFIGNTKYTGKVFVSLSNGSLFIQ